MTRQTVGQDKTLPGLNERSFRHTFRTSLTRENHGCFGNRKRRVPIDTHNDYPSNPWLA